MSAYSIYSSLSGYASRWRSAREAAYTRRVIDGLPNEVLKDIGWPEGSTRFDHHENDHSWFGRH